ncbi:MAG: hypothetical protein JSS65_04950 [Armatimonadetes bacterium]|nr:hypothetical protein [Armatimonadota bacterium]
MGFKASCFVVVAVCVGSLALAQGGGGGFGGGLGGFQGGQGGRGGQDGTARNGQRLDEQIAQYLSGPEHEHILTPGDFTDWPLKLEEGQVVIAEASSIAFDPALEVVDSKGKVLASNDDRYPGDQRPLLLWRCPAKGEYSLHGRCFRDKSGGQYKLRFEVFDTVDAPVGQVVEKKLATEHPVLVRVPLKRGQIVEGIDLPQDGQDRFHLRFYDVISPCGLPDLDLLRTFQPTLGDTSLLAVADGDYYFLGNTVPTKGTIKIQVVEHKPMAVKPESRAKTVAPSKAPVDIWTFTAKAGEYLQVRTPELAPYSQSTIEPQPEMPEAPKKADDWSAFYPEVPDPKKDRSPAFYSIRGRARDVRLTNFKVNKDTTFWVVTRPQRQGEINYSLQIVPLAKPLPDANATRGQLRIGDADFWSFEGQVGDVVVLETQCKDFYSMARLVDSDSRELAKMVSPIDGDRASTTVILRKTGINLLEVSSPGEGGGGEYAVTRKLVPPQVFDVSKPAAGELDGNKVQVWKFVAKPGEPLLVKWDISNPAVRLRALDEAGHDVGFPLQRVNDNKWYGVLTVDKERTFIVVVEGAGPKATYAMTLSALAR